MDQINVQSPPHTKDSLATGLMHSFIWALTLLLLAVGTCYTICYTITDSNATSVKLAEVKK